MTERPQGLATLVDPAPRSTWPRSHPDKTTNDEAPTLPLPEQQSAQAPPDIRIEVVEGAHYGISAARSEEVQPSAEVRVERGDTAPEGLAPRSRRQLADSRIDADFRPLRQEDFDRAVLRRAPEAEADEVPFFGTCYRTLGLIHLEAQPPFDKPDHTGHHPVPCAFASDVDIRVVGVAHEVVAAPGKLAVEFVQHDVTEQR
jgi:hypothetical protein